MSDVIEWEARTKTIKQLIKELQSFENQELVVMVTNDEGKTFNSVKLVSKGVTLPNLRHLINRIKLPD